MGLGYHQFGEPHHFDTNTLSWSAHRLFAQYLRIVSVSDPFGVGPNHGDKLFLDTDIEGFIIRLRILLNDLAFIIRQLYPKHVRYLSPPSGRGSPRNHEMSI